MKLKKNTYWKGLEQFTNDPDFIKHAEKEFPAYLPIKDAYGDNSKSEEGHDASRRDFLKLMGFSVAAVSLAACEAPVKKAIPYLNNPEDVVASIPNFYASSYVQGGEYCAVIVKTREGRPILVEGNPDSPLTQGGINARVSASVLSLYDAEKARKPSKGGEQAEWAALDKEIMAKLSSLGGDLYIISHTILSPSTKRLIAEFGEKAGVNVKHVSYDPISRYAIAKAHQNNFGKKVIPSYDFSKAEVIVGINADFLGEWISEIEHAKQYAETRRISKDKKQMSRHYQFESMLSITGASADYRTPIRPSEEVAVVAALYNAICGGNLSQGKLSNELANKNLQRCLKDLTAANGKALVVSGSNNVGVQELINAINERLGAYGSTIDLETPSYQRQGDDEQMAAFVDALKGGSVAGVIFYNCNPVYDYPAGADIAAALGKVKLSISTAERLDETASLCQYHTPDRHYLESWNDAEPKKGHLALVQPTINPIFDTRQFQDSLIKWAGMEGDYYTYIQKTWEARTGKTGAAFARFWKTVLHDGVYPKKGKTATIAETPTVATATATEAAGEMTAPAETTAKTTTVAAVTDFTAPDVSALSLPSVGGADTLELVIYASAVMGNGMMANNPWIQETPEPITKLTWGQALLVSVDVAMAKGLSTKENDTAVAKLSVGDKSYNLPVIVQPGLAKNTLALPVGYGRTKEKAGKVAAEAAGINAYELATWKGGVQFYALNVQVEAVGETELIAQTQTHHTFLGRETIIQEALLKDYQDVKALQEKRYEPKIATSKGPTTPTEISIWDIQNDWYGESGDLTKKYENKKVPEYRKDLWLEKHPIGVDVHLYPNHHWGMVIDLNTCTGCSACVVACHLENNVPVVGKKEVAVRRDMHWMRIDRYYSSSTTDKKDYDNLKIVSENPEVVFQPMMCQHCNNAPCETVCPVAATTHSSEGLNQMTYNRCVGTKYCANNCPYKVRRFNWFKYNLNKEFDYHMNDELGRMVLNPDVTVRSRGVMEKCSLCVQRIQEGKLRAKKELRKVRDGEIITACASACPTQAITFGDLNDPNSKIVQVLEGELDKRAYNVLAEINTRPNVWYLTKVRNQDEAFVPTSPLRKSEA
jgi:molybdopterin-containing oxidoreductase family iron-sulfur binding subunit